MVEPRHLLDLSCMMRGVLRLHNLLNTAARFLVFLLFLLLVAMPQGDSAAVHGKEDLSSSTMSSRAGEEQWLSRMGSRPPCCHCERRCGGCAPCTAVLVRAAALVGPQPQCANYEPIRWKCKCANVVFDP